MRYDRWKEFTFNEFQDFCEVNEIRRPLTILRSPQQNGRVEGKNKTIFDMVRNMLKTKRLSNEFWAEAIVCEVYLYNKFKQEMYEARHHKKHRVVENWASPF